jgi:hypothetical protein
MLWLMVYGMNFDMLTDKKLVWMGFVFCSLHLSAGRLHFLLKKALWLAAIRYLAMIETKNCS